MQLTLAADWRKGFQLQEVNQSLSLGVQLLVGRYILEPKTKAPQLVREEGGEREPEGRITLTWTLKVRTSTPSTFSLSGSFS